MRSARLAMIGSGELGLGQGQVCPASLPLESEKEAELPPRKTVERV